MSELQVLLISREYTATLVYRINSKHHKRFRTPGHFSKSMKYSYSSASSFAKAADIVSTDSISISEIHHPHNNFGANSSNTFSDN
jgi:hypothetical protein